MKDDKGKYYYPFPQNKRVKMYVHKNQGEICFRMWNADDPKMWDDHGWVPYSAIKAATGMYKGKNFKPTQAYDIEVARAVLREKM